MYSTSVHLTREMFKLWTTHVVGHVKGAPKVSLEEP